MRAFPGILIAIQCVGTILCFFWVGDAIYVRDFSAACVVSVLAIAYVVSVILFSMMWHVIKREIGHEGRTK